MDELLRGIIGFFVELVETLVVLAILSAFLVLLVELLR
jgi:hypothetical protein